MGEKNMTTGNSSVFHVHTCKTCKRKFTMICRVDKYGWEVTRNNTRYLFCSYSCMRKYEKSYLEKIRLKKEREFDLAARCINGEIPSRRVMQ